MSDDGTSKPGMLRRWLAFLWRPPVTFFGTFGAIALYFLSVGPAFVLFWKLPPDRWGSFFIGAFYSPLAWVAQKSARLGFAIEAYVESWAVTFNHDPRIAIHHWSYVDEPPYFTEIAGAVIAAWTIWTVVRWINRRGLTRV
jgi:hypothetical protein